MPQPSLFISYSSSDRVLAECLDAALAARGFNVWRDQTRLEQDWSKEIAHALADADVVLLLWSTEAARSKWVAHEWLTARALEKHILPCLLTNAPDLPPALANVHGVTASTAADFASAAAKRLEEIASYRVAYDYTVAPAQTYIPFNPNPDFTGRSADMMAVYLAAIGNLNKTGLSHVGIVGMAGIGKTQLAVEFAHRFAFGFPNGIFWIQAADPDQWLQQLLELARDRLHLAVADAGEAQVGKQYVYALQNYCKTHPGVLLVMDNVTEPELLNNETRLFGLTPLTLGCSVLFTSRKRVTWPGVRVQSVDALEPAAAYTLLTRSRAPGSEQERASAMAIANAVACLPLALTLAAGYLSKYGDVSYTEYLVELKSHKLDVIDIGALSADELATRHETSVVVTLMGQWTMLQDETARRLFRLLGQFSEAAIVPERRIMLLSGILPKSNLDRPVTRALNLLADLHLVERMTADRSAIRLHPLVRDFAARLTAPGDAAALRQSAAANLKSGYDDPQRLMGEIASRGPSQIIADISLAINWGEAGSSIADELDSLRRLLDRELNNLQGGAETAAGAPASILQQLQYRAFHMRFDALAGRFLAAAQRPFFTPVAASAYEDSAVVRAFVGHRGSVSAVEQDAAGGRIVSGSSDNSVVIWDVGSGQALHTFTDEHQVWQVALSENGQWALSGGSGSRLTLRDLSTGRTTIVFEGRGDGSIDSIGCRAVRFHQQATQSISAWLGTSSLHWTETAGATLHTHKDLDGLVRAVCFNGDGTQALISLGEYLVQAGEGGQWVPAKPNERLLLVSTHTGEILNRFPSALTHISAIFLTPDGTVAVAGSRDSLLIWRLDTGRVVRLQGGHDNWVTAIAMTPDRRFILSGSADLTLVLWNAETGKSIRRYEGHSGAVTGVVVQPEGRHAISASEDGTLILWDLRSPAPPRHSPGHSDLIPAVCLSKKGTRALTGSFDKTLKLWDVASARPLHTYPGHPDNILAAAMSGDAKLALSGCANNEVLVWDLQAGKVRHTLRGHRNTVSAVAFSPDGTRAVSGSRDELIVWDLLKGEPLSSADEDAYWYLRVGFTADGQRLVTCATADITIWDIVGPEVKCHRRMEGLWHQSAHVDAGNNLALASASGSLYLWDLATGDLRKKFPAHSHDVQAVCLSLDGKYAVTACKDERVLALWNLDSAEAIARLKVKSPIVALAVTGSRLAFTDESRLVHFMDLAL